MNKNIIIRHLKNELSTKETENLFRWIEKSEHNRRYYHTVKNLWTITSLHQSPDAVADFDDLKQRMDQKKRLRTALFIGIKHLTRIAAILAIPLAAGVIWLITERREVTPLVQTDNPIITIYTPLCTRAYVALPDGTCVWLNSGSKLSYPRLFEGTTRSVTLEGEAFFDVVKNESYPFVVKTPYHIEIEVKGTLFNLCAYEEDKKTELTLISGAVNMIDEHTGKKIDLKPLQSASYEQNNNVIDVKSNIDPELYTSWKEGILVFDHISLYDLSKRLERWYGVTINIEDTDMLNYTYTGRFKEETIGQVLELIQQSSNIAYRMEDKMVSLFRKK